MAKVLIDGGDLVRRLVPQDRRVFLSYARLDDEVPIVDPPPLGWVRYLYEQLRVALRQRLGGEVEFWRDLKDIDDNEIFKPLILKGLDGSTLLLAVVSPGYLNSKWCKTERELFIARRGSSDATVEQVIKILKHRVDEQLLPDELRRRTGYRFFIVDPDTSREIPLYFNGKLRREAEYFDTVERLVDYIVAHLLAAPAPAPSKVVAPVPGSALFLALPQGTDTSEPTLRLRAALEAAGAHVAQPIARALSELEARDSLRRLLVRSRAAIHVVGRSAGAILRNGSVPAVHLQLDESGQQVERRPAFRRYILVLATHAQGSDEHRSYVERLQVDASEGGLLQETDVLVREQPGGMTVQEFIQVVQDGIDE